MKHYKHLLGSYKISDADKAIDLAQRQFKELVKRGELNKGKNMAYVQIEVYLVDGEPEK